MTFKCQSESCRAQLNPKSYNFQHQICRKKLCFWCVLQIYKREIQNVKPKLSKKPMATLKITMPCCKASEDDQLIKLESFILSGCPFDGVKCQSRQRYNCASGLWIGKQCLSQFFRNFKQTKEQKRIQSKIELHAKNKCKQCHLEKVSAISPNYINQNQYKFQLQYCQDCLLKKATDQSKKQIKPNICCKCKQPQILQDGHINNKNSQFCTKKFNLVKTAQTLYCYFCIYTNIWIVTCQKFKYGEITFEKLINSFKNCQQIFQNKCLTCGNQPQKNQNVFQFNNQSIQSPYKLHTFLCGHCHMMITQDNKITKTLNRLRQYLHQSKQLYGQIIQSVKFKQFKENAGQRVIFYLQILGDKKLIEKYENNYQFKIQQKLKQKILLRTLSSQVQNQESLKKSPNTKAFGQIRIEQQRNEQLSKQQKILQQKKRSSIKKDSKDVQERPKSIKKITSTAENKKKFDQIQVIKNRQGTLKLDSDKRNIQKIDKYRRTQPIKSYKQMINRTSRKTTAQNQALQRIKINKQASIQQKQRKSFGNVDEKQQNISEREQSSIIDLTDSRQSESRNLASEQDMNYKEEESYNQTGKQITPDKQNLRIYQNDFNDSEDDQFRKTSFHNRKDQIQNYDKNHLEEDNYKKQWAKENSQNKNKNLLKDILLSKQSNQQITGQNSKQLLDTKTPQQIFAQLKSTENNFNLVQQKTDQDIFSVKLKQWNFEPSAYIKPAIPKIGFDKKLVTIVDQVQTFFPSLLQDAKSRCQFEPIQVQSQKVKYAKIAPKITQPEIINCKNCHQKQLEPLLLQKYCLLCFKFVLVGKLKCKESESQTQK